MSAIQYKVDPANSRYEGTYIFELIWYDDRLKWNPQNFENKKRIKLKSDSIWIPDLNLQGFADNSNLKIDQRQSRIDYDGRIRILFDYYLSGYCEVHPMYFPYDFHACFMPLVFNELEEHEYDIFRLEAAVSTDIYNPEWTILKYGTWPIPAVPFKEIFPNQSYPGSFDDESLATIYINTVVERKPNYALITFIIPVNCTIKCSIESILYQPVNHSDISSRLVDYFWIISSG